MFTSIVVAIDGSSHSLQALSFSSELAAVYDAELGIIHVVESNIFGLPGDITDVPAVEKIANSSPNLFSNLDSFRQDTFKSIGQASGESYRLAIQLAERIVDEAESHAKVDGAKKITKYIAAGNVVDEILNFAARQEADIIVTGQRGLGAIKSVLLGSTSAKLSHIAPCTTVIVK